jgi:hypothetical protein
MNRFACARVAPQKPYQIPRDITQLRYKSVFIALGSLVYRIPTQKYVWVYLNNRDR